MAALTLLKNLREQADRSEEQARYQRERFEQQQERDTQRGLSFVEARVPLKEIETAIPNVNSQGRALWRIADKRLGERAKEEEASAGFNQVLAPAQRRAETLTDVNTPDFANLVSQLALSGHQMGATPDQMTPGIATLPFLVQAAKAERERQEQERAASQRKSLAEILAQQRATTYLGVTLEEELQGRRFALANAEEARAAESGLGLEESQEERRARLEGRAKARGVFDEEYYTGRKLSQGMALDALSDRIMQEQFEAEKNQPPPLLRRPGYEAPKHDWESEIAKIPELVGLPYARARAENMAQQKTLANAPRLEVWESLQKDGINPTIVPSHLIKALQPGETSTGRYIPPAAFRAARTGLPMPIGSGARDQSAVEEGEAALANLDLIEAAVLELREAKGDVGRIGRVKEWAMSYFQTGEGDPNATFLNSLRQLDASLIARGVSGETGALAQGDVARALSPLPNVLEGLAKDDRKFRARLLAARRTAMNSVESKYRQHYKRADYLSRFKQAEIDGVDEQRQAIRDVLGGPGVSEGIDLFDLGVRAAKGAIPEIISIEDPEIISIEEIR